MRLFTDNVVKKYRSRTVVKGVSVSVEQGEIVGLLGPNGAGKTTTFYMMTKSSTRELHLLRYQQKATRYFLRKMMS